MGSTSDLPIMEKAAKLLDECEIPFEMLALSAHRTPAEVEEFAKNARSRGIKVIIAAAGMAAHLPGVIASMTTLPVIGVPIKSGMEGLDALLAIVQMPPGIPVATVGVNAALNAAILATQILALGDENIASKVEKYKTGLTKKIVDAKGGEVHKFRTGDQLHAASSGNPGEPLRQLENFLEGGGGKAAAQVAVGIHKADDAAAGKSMQLLVKGGELCQVP